MKRQKIPKSLDGIRRKTDGTRIIARRTVAQPRDFNFYSVAARPASARVTRKRIQRKPAAD